MKKPLESRAYGLHLLGFRYNCNTAINQKGRC